MGTGVHIDIVYMNLLASARHVFVLCGVAWTWMQDPCIIEPGLIFLWCMLYVINKGQ